MSIVALVIAPLLVPDENAGAKKEKPKPTIETVSKISPELPASGK